MGISAITDDKHSGNNRKLTFKEEQELLAPFEKDAKNGKMLVVADIKAAFDKKFGITSSAPTIYKLIKRHNWRKIMPRSQHPKKQHPKPLRLIKKITCKTSEMVNIHKSDFRLMFQDEAGFGRINKPYCYLT